MVRGDGQQAPNEAEEAAIRAHVVKCTTDLRLYCQSHFGDDPSVTFRKELDLFKVARIIDPSVVRQQRDDVQPKALRKLPFVTKEEVVDLIAKLPQHINVAAAARVTYPVRSVWVNNAVPLPGWFTVVKKLWLVRPSSAIIVRVFSVLDNVLARSRQRASTTSSR